MILLTIEINMNFEKFRDGMELTTLVGIFMLSLLGVNPNV
jgi:hypothetical protein